MGELTKQYFIQGKVQQAGFRMAVKRQAQLLNLGGYTRNLPDGRVEVVVTGHAPRLQRLADWLWQGPPSAKVDRVTEHDIQPENFNGFNIKNN